MRRRGARRAIPWPGTCARIGCSADRGDLGVDGAPVTVAPILSRFSTTLPAIGSPAWLTLSRDGSRFAYVGAEALIYVRATGELTAAPLTGTDDAIQPFFSPDGRSNRYRGTASSGKCR